MHGRTSNLVRWLGTLALLFFWIIVCLGSPVKVSAHAELLTTDPPAGAVLDRPPGHLFLTFSEPVDILGHGVVILSPDGRTVEATRIVPLDTDRRSLRAEFPRLDQRGTYVVRYSVIGLDGHLVTGRFSFAIGAPSGAEHDISIADWIMWAQASARLLELLGLTFLLGSLVLRIATRDLVAMREAERFCRRTGLVGTLVAVLSASTMLATVPATLGAELDWKSLATAASSRTTLPWLASLVLSVLLSISLGTQRSSRLELPAWIVGAAALVIVRALQGHAVTAPLPALSVALAAIHTATAAALIGSTVLLGMIVRRATADDPTFGSSEILLRRWFIVSLVSAEPLVLTGAYGLWVNVDSPVSLWTTWYGRFLLGKFVLLALLAVPALSALRTWFLTRQLPWGALRASVAPLLLILLAASGLTLVGPARPHGALGDPPPSLSLAQNAGPYLVTLSIVPAQAGVNQVDVTVTAPNGQPVEDAQVTVAIETPMGPTLVHLSRASSAYRGTLNLDPQVWDLVVYVQRPGESTSHAARFSVPVPVPDGRVLLQAVDRAMNELTAVEERTLLTSGGPRVETVVRYRAPDRAAYRVEAEGRPPSETIIINTVRYDRSGMEPWTKSPWPGSEPFRWPSYRFAETAENVRILGTETVDDVPCYLLSFYDPSSDAHYRLWVGMFDLRIRRYDMMAPGHYMTGTFERFDDPSITVDPPAEAGAAASPQRNASTIRGIAGPRITT